jgi:hypothetical protein
LKPEVAAPRLRAQYSLFVEHLLGNWEFLENTISHFIVSAWLHAAVVQINFSVCCFVEEPTHVSVCTTLNISPKIFALRLGLKHLNFSFDSFVLDVGEISFLS